MILYTDGGSRGNPGPAAIGAVLMDNEKNTLKEISKYIGKATNNEAEYKALIEGLKSAVSKDNKQMKCYLDSELIVKQLNGEYKVKNERIKVFWAEIKKLEKNFDTIEYFHVKREFNKHADRLVNEALDAEMF